VPNTGKRYRAASSLVEPERRYPLEEALDIVKKGATAKFDESVDIAVRLGVDPKKADQMVRGAVTLPHGTGKTVRVLVFAEGDAARAAEEAGADFVGGNELINKIQNEGWVDFDKAIAIRSMMAKVGRIGRILGPRGLMPNPRTGTVVGPEEVADAVRDVKGGKIDFKVEKAGIIHASIGRASMPADHLRNNLLAVMATLVRLKPSTAKGIYVRGVAVSSTMGPGLRLEPNEVLRQSAGGGEA
jgi:large subunit ribosomal protein L1